MKFPINRYPYTDYTKINLDWIMKKLQYLVNEALPDIIPVRKGGTGATTAADARTNLGLGSVVVENVVPINKGGSGATTASAARTNLGLGSVATENTVPVNKGGTGATTASAARTNLGLGSVATENTVPVNKGGTGATTASAARTNLGLDTVELDLSDPVRGFQTGDIITLRIHYTFTPSAQGWYTIYTLPESLRPHLAMEYLLYNNAAGTTASLPVMVRIESETGIIKFWAYDTSQYIVYGTCVFPV